MKSNLSDEEFDHNIADPLETEMIPKHEGKTASAEGDFDAASRRTPTSQKSVDYTRVILPYVKYLLLSVNAI